MKYDVDGHLLLSFGKIGDFFGEFVRPKGIAVDKEGLIYVVDAGMQQVSIFNPQGRLLMVFGTPGLPRGSMNLPAAIWVTTDNLEYFKRFSDPSFEVNQLIFVTNQSGWDKVSVYGFGHRKGSAPAGAEKGQSTAAPEESKVPPKTQASPAADKASGGTPRDPKKP
jgi:hypothetical protein